MTEEKAKMENRGWKTTSRIKERKGKRNKNEMR